MFRPVPDAPLKSSLKTVVQPEGAAGTAAAAGVVPVNSTSSPASSESTAEVAIAACLRRRGVGQDLIDLRVFMGMVSLSGWSEVATVPVPGTRIAGTSRLVHGGRRLCAQQVAREERRLVEGVEGWRATDATQAVEQGVVAAGAEVAGDAAGADGGLEAGCRERQGPALQPES